MKKKNRMLKLSKETLRTLGEPGLDHAHGGQTLGCPTKTVCSDCQTVVTCETCNGCTVNTVC